MPDQAMAPIDVARDVYRSVRQFPRIKKNPALSALAASTDSNVNLPVGETYRRIDLVPTIAGVAATEAQMVAQISRLQFIIDGDTKIDITGEDAVMLQNYYERRAGLTPITDGILSIDFARPWHREITGEDDPAWGTRDVRSFEMILTLAAGATIDACNTYRHVTDPEEMGRHLCIRRKPRNVAAAGLDRLSDWKREIGTSLLAIHVKKTTITDVKFTVDDMIELDCTYQLLQQYGRAYERVDQEANGYSHIDFAVRNRLRDGLPMIAQTMDLDFTWSGAPGAHSLLLEQIEGPAR